MHVILNPLGSHGDVHPFIALGMGLKSRGHQVTLVTAAPFEHLAQQHGLDFRAIGTTEDYQTLIQNPDLWHPTKSFSVLFGGELFERLFRQTYFVLAELAQQPESVLVAGSLSLAARLAQEKLGVPLATVHLQPLAFFSLADPPTLATVRVRRWWPMWFRRFVLWLGHRCFTDPLLRPPMNRLRAELGLPSIRGVFGNWRHSPQRLIGLFPDWYATAPDWPPQTALTGFLRYDQADGQPTSPALQEFLTKGPPPVIFSFGSAMRTGRAYFEAAVQACQQGGFRGVLLAKGGEQIPTPLPDEVFHADYAPFSQVFPQAAAVVHHGGIGTTAQALNAGVPQLIMPMAFDQPDNAARLEKLGVARTLWPSHFTGANVAQELRELLKSEQYRQTSAALAQRMRQADPLAATCELVEALRPGRVEPVTAQIATSSSSG